MDDSGGLKLRRLHHYLKYYGVLIYDEENISCSEGSQMRPDWSSLPLLALKQVLSYLSRQDALSAMSTCRHWRSALLMYEDYKTTLKLRVNDIERSLFVTRIFRKQTKKLIVIVNICDEEQITKFMNVVMSLFYDIKLQELVFVANSYLNLNPHAAIPQLPRETVESMVLNVRSLKRLALMGCSLSPARDQSQAKNKKCSVKRVRVQECIVRDPSPADTVLSRCNQGLMMYSGLQAMMLDYDLINTDSLETLSELKMFRHLTMVIRDKPRFALEPIDWLRLQTAYATPLKVTVCLLQLPYEKIDEVMDNVFVQGLNLVSLKALFCKTMHLSALIQVVGLYNKSLQELVWTDAPCNSQNGRRTLKPARLPELNMCNVNPLILMCWQCERLKRVVLHGYWIWQYDVLGMMRLRRGLRHLELSSVLSQHGHAAHVGEGISRVMRDDPGPRCDLDFLEQVNKHNEMSGWTPVPWARLHPGLRAHASRQQRADYILMELRTPFGFTYPYTFWRHRYYEHLVLSSSNT